jgi:hypothetical protein
LEEGEAPAAAIDEELEALNRCAAVHLLQLLPSAINAGDMQPAADRAIERGAPFAWVHGQVGAQEEAAAVLQQGQLLLHGVSAG